MSITLCRVNNGLPYTVTVNGISCASDPVPPFPLVSVSENALVFSCTALPSASCNLVNVDDVVLDLTLITGKAYSAQWMYSSKNTIVPASSCVGAPLVTVGAFAFLCFAQIDVTVNGSSCQVVLTPYTPFHTSVASNAFNQMIGKPRRDPTVPGSVPTGVYSESMVQGLVPTSDTEMMLVPNAPFSIANRLQPSPSLQGTPYLYLYADTTGDDPAIYFTLNPLQTTFFSFALLPSGNYGLAANGQGYYLSFAINSDQSQATIQTTANSSDAAPVGLVLNLQSQLLPPQSTFTQGAGVVLLFYDTKTSTYWTFNANTPWITNQGSINTKAAVLYPVPTDNSVVDLDSVPGLASDLSSQLAHVQCLVLPNSLVSYFTNPRKTGAVSCFALNTFGCPGGNDSADAQCFFKDTQVGGIVCGTDAEPLSSSQSMLDLDAIADVVTACEATSSECATLDGLPLATCTGWHALSQRTLCAEACAYTPALCDAKKLAYCAAHPNVPECGCINLESNPTPAAEYGLSYREYVCGIQSQLGINPDTEYHGQCWWPLCDPQSGALTLSDGQASSVCPASIAECYTLLANNTNINVNILQNECGMSSKTVAKLHCGTGSTSTSSQPFGPYTPPLPPDRNNGQTLSQGALIGIVVGAIVLVLAAIGAGLGVYFHKRHKAKLAAQK